MALDVEEVGEVGLVADLEADGDRFPSVVHDVEVLVDSMPDLAVDAEVHRLGGDGAVRRHQVGIGELEASGERTHLGAVEQQRCHAPELQPIAGNEPRVSSEVALLPGAGDLGVWRADDDLVVGMDGDGLRSNLHFHR